ncbi:MAG: methyltransferase domain-containing protein [Deltaproteobacteria bacterium]|nr:methyltransferase domain-containing protein [Deltaproteobacteria bacterium]
MMVTDAREKWNRRYEERLAEGWRPEPNPLAQRLRPRLGGALMLDAACGLGSGLAAVGDLYQRVLAVDLSDTAIRAARQQYHGASHICWIVADVTRLRWPSNGLDLVCAFGFTDWGFLRAVPAILAPGGWLLYEGFSRRQITVKPDLDPAWTSTPEDLRNLVPGWQVWECEESTGEPPYRVVFAARKPGQLSGM